MSADKEPEPRQAPEPKDGRHKRSPQHDNGDAQWRPFPWGEASDGENGDANELPPFTL